MMRRNSHGMRSGSDNRHRSRQDALYLVVLVLVGLSIAVIAHMSVAAYIANPVADLRGNVDWGYLNRGLDRVHSFRDTARWWTGTWCGEVPFWRPLTSYVFWAMRLLWPPEYMLPRQIVSVALHLCFTAMAGVFLWKLTRRRWLTLVAVWLFAGLRFPPVSPFFGHIASVGDVLADPKNFPDPLVGVCILASLLCIMSGRWIAGVIAAAVSVGVKEIGFTTWPLAVIALAWIHRDQVFAAGGVRYAVKSIRRNWFSVAVWLLALGLLILVRYRAVGFGYNCGTNGAWFWRALAYFGGPVGAELVTRDFSPPLAAGLLFTVATGFRKASLLTKLFAVLVALTLVSLFDAHLQHTPWDVAAARLFIYRPNPPMIGICLFWLLVAREARRDWRTVVLGGVMCFVAAAPSFVVTQALDHARYTASFFMEIVVAAALCRSARALWERFVPRPVGERPS